MSCLRENSITIEQRLDEKLSNSNICWKMLCVHAPQKQNVLSVFTILSLYPPTWKTLWAFAFSLRLLYAWLFEVKMTRIVKKLTNSEDFASWNTSTRKFRPTVWASVTWTAPERVLAAASTFFLARQKSVKWTRLHERLGLKITQAAQILPTWKMSWEVWRLYIDNRYHAYI